MKENILLGVYVCER